MKKTRNNNTDIKRNPSESILNDRKMGKVEILEPIKKKKLAEEIAEKIRRRILDGTFKPGEKLPAERELARRMNVNRGSIREGLKILQQLGLISIKHGDGTRVLDFFQTASIEIVNYLLNDSPLERKKILSDIMEVRKMICTEIVKLAARNASNEDIEELRKQLEETKTGGGLSHPEGKEISEGHEAPEKEDKDYGEIVVKDFEFYENLSKISGNLIYKLMLNTVKPPFKFFKPIFKKLVHSPTDVLETHKKILDAIAARNEKLATEIAEEYLTRTAEFFLNNIDK